MSDPGDSATREEWNRQWKASRPRERREMIRLARKKFRESPEGQAQQRAVERWSRKFSWVCGVLFTLAAVASMIMTLT